MYETIAAPKRGFEREILSKLFAFALSRKYSRLP